MKFCTCHAHLSHLTKPYFHQVHYVSHVTVADELIEMVQ